MHQNSKCRLCGDRIETINHIISECPKLAQKEYKTRHDWMSKVIHWDMWKKLKLDHTNIWYMHNPAAVHTNGSPNLGQKTRPYSYKQQQKKRPCKIVDFAVPADHRINLKESEKKGKYLNLAKELKKLWNMKVTIMTIVFGAFCTVTKGLLKGLEDLEVEGRVGTIQTTALLRTATIMTTGILETWGGLLSLKLKWKTIS